MSAQKVLSYYHKRILYAVLNWGLGHATRSIPIIHRLINQKNEVYIASDGDSLQLLKTEFPNLKTAQLPAYNIKYYQGNMALGMMMQLPKLCNVFINEKYVVSKLLRKEYFDIIISDHRYGVNNSKVKQNIFIGHQLNILSSKLQKHKLASTLNKYLINKFDICLIPDYPSNDKRNLSGKLGSVEGLKNFAFVGPLSRLKGSPFPKKYDAAIVLSGPEPLRSVLEKKLIKQMNNSKFSYCMVRGVFKDDNNIKESSRIKVVNNMSSKLLEHTINQSRLVICRAGYSSIMDMCAMNKSAILVPTPGQTEQLYLASHLKNHPLFTIRSEHDLHLQNDLTSYFELN